MKDNTNPFAKLGALDQKLYQPTAPKPQPPSEGISGNPENQNARNPDFQKTSNLEPQKTSFPEIKQTSIPETQKTSIPANQNTDRPEKREFFTKVTYRICDAAVDAIEDAKKILKRQYGLKVNLEEVVETAILKAYQDLLDNKEKSALVIKYSGNPENQKT